MKYFLLFLIILSFIGPAVDDSKSIGDIVNNSIYNYITSVDNTVSYLVDNVSLFSNISEKSYKASYESYSDSVNTAEGIKPVHSFEEPASLNIISS